MAAGTVVSRMSGYVRSILLAAALGNLLHADIFTIANTIPNMLYILLAGGVFNAVLVPQLVRAMKNDADGGEAYTNRVVTLAALFLGVVTRCWSSRRRYVMRLFLSAQLGRPGAGRAARVGDRLRPALPAAGVLLRHVRAGRADPQLPRPVRADDVGADRQQRDQHGRPGDLPRSSSAPRRHRRRLLAAARSCCSASARRLGIALQFLILVPYLRAAGFHYRPRFDFRGTGLGHTLRLGIWTVLFVVVNQIAYTVVVRLASSGTADVARSTPAPATRSTPARSCW